MTRTGDAEPTLDRVAAALRNPSQSSSAAHAGVRVTLVQYNGTIHDFVVLNARAYTPATRRHTASGRALQLALG
ncbi:MAG: hypothetical protein JOY71_07465 [Acetobacteraceae bacterium]|nr:hypothetical protein [Acetobacteraceae bacterium]